MNIIDEIALLAALYCIKNFKPYNKYLQFFTKYIDVTINKILIHKFLSQLKGIWGYYNLENYKQLIKKISKQFVV